jgi:hemerythrin-like metal-binding protein
MKDLVWSDTLSVEVREVDDDHRRLVDLFNLLNHAVNEGSDARYIGILMEELVNCTAWHFSHEERLMLKHGFEGFEEHKEEHEELLAGARELQQRLQQEGRSISDDDVEFLEHWLTAHILTTDMKMGAYLAGMM